jgi:hypothetical protein
MPAENYGSKFIDEKIEVFYRKEPLLEKKPTCPDTFLWGLVEFTIVEKILEWVDFSRHGRMARNMSDTHSITAASKGSWGVGKFYFRVQTDKNRIFDIYYDRAPKGSAMRKGQWFVFREIFTIENDNQSRILKEN